MIYFIQCGDDGPIKIGASVDPKQRLHLFQIGCPYELSLIGLMDGSYKKEKSLHNRFKHIKMRGEWFAPSSVLLKFIEKNASRERLSGVLLRVYKEIVGEQVTNWRKLCSLEPKLLELLQEIETIKDDSSTSSFCANYHWYYNKKTRFKARLNELVGWYAEKPIAELRTQKAYDIAYKKCYDALPDCRNCYCLGM